MKDFAQVYDLYFRDVYKYTLGISRDAHLAEEITQETFFKALNSLDTFKGDCKLSVWLCQIAKNCYMSHCRKGKYLTSGVETDQMDSGMNLEEQISDKETVFAVHKILHRMEEPYKEVFSLRTFGELSFKQIGELFGKTENWARVTYHRAKLKIKEELK